MKKLIFFAIIMLIPNLLCSGALKAQSLKQDSGKVQNVQIPLDDLKFINAALNDYVLMDKVIIAQNGIIHSQDTIIYRDKEQLLLKDSEIALYKLEKLKLQGQMQIQEDYYKRWYRNPYITGGIGFGIGILINVLR